MSPSYATAHADYGTFLSARGRHAEAIQSLHRAVELDPLNYNRRISLGEALRRAGKLDDAVEQARKARAQEPRAVRVHYLLGSVYMLRGLHEQAIREYQQLALHTKGELGLPLLAYAYAAAGKRVEALTTLAELRKQEEKRYVPAGDFALVYTSLGDKDRALDWLGKAYQDRDEAIPWLARDPFFAPLRSEPRFAALLAQAGLDP